MVGFGGQFWSLVDGGVWPMVGWLGSVVLGFGQWGSNGGGFQMVMQGLMVVGFEWQWGLGGKD